eukprot:TRINITY_DN9824_c0_g1_i4.p1 TRINITY_DN9824_c0_g1~~TRINITY_DN9824_c0_g1_i4.p1  ORF type:complete len:255 (-),score=19.84 TRINITY_DN9824_c0_g1_i4:679-1443(-)
MCIRDSITCFECYKFTRAQIKSQMLTHYHEGSPNIDLYTTNPLLVRSQVGKPKLSVRSLPPIDHSYGKPYNRDPEGAKEVSMTWKFHQHSDGNHNVVDFMQINKKSLQHGLTSSKEVHDFRKSHEITKSPLRHVVSHNILRRSDIPATDIIYGIKNRVPTPIGRIIRNEYGNEATGALTTVYNDRFHEFEERGKGKRILPKLNKSTVIKQERLQRKKSQEELVQGRELYKIQRFLEVEPRIQTRFFIGREIQCD